MKVLFRTDASLAIGSGHVMRCLTLAQALKRQGAECRFFMRQHPGHRAQAVETAGFEVDLLGDGLGPTSALAGDGPAHAHWLGTDWTEDAAEFRRAAGESRADWLVLDHYGLDQRWERTCADLAGRLLVIDDLADRPHACQLLLDQNLGRSDADYAAWTPTDCQRLTGPRYALLRDGFAARRADSLARRPRGPIRRLLIAMGGIDADDATGRCLQALDRLPQADSLEVDVVMGGAAPHLAPVQALAERLRFACTTVHVDTPEMPALMQRADLALGAAGSSAWERCALGLPTLLAVIADNQWPGARALAATGAAYLLGSGHQIEAALPQAWAQVAEPGWLTLASERAAAVCDGLGTARVVQAMERQA